MNSITRFSLLVVVLLLVSGTCSAASLNPLAGMVIMLDAGHGGTDPGAVGPTGLKEADVNLRVAKYLRQLLTADGATVLMTREDSRTLSLQDRVDLSAKAKPDLFVSVHHNASGVKVHDNKGEIYFNALDAGMPLELASRMEKELAESRLSSGTKTIPGGFFVLRKNSAPAILTEASYIDVPENEKHLSTGRALVREALVFRKAIRDVFATPLLRVEILTGDPARANGPYFNLLVNAAEPLAGIDMRLEGSGRSALGFEKLPSFGNFYTIFNLQPLQTGDYKLTAVFRSEKGQTSLPRKVNLQVRLPPQEAVLFPVAPFIPNGFKGEFPVRILLKDGKGRPNRQALPFQVSWNGHDLNGTTRDDGQAVVLLPLDGSETGMVKTILYVNGKQVGMVDIAVRDPERVFILGQVSSSLDGKGLERVRVRYGSDRLSITGPGGYFYCDLPLMFRNLDLQLHPPAGYRTEHLTVRAGNESILTPKIVMAPVAPKLLGKKVAILAARSEDEWVRPLVRQLMRAGVRVVRLKMGGGAFEPQMMAVAQANSIPQLDLLLSFKRGDARTVQLRHYYRSKGGKKLAADLAAAYRLRERNRGLSITAGPDYELSHSGPTALVVAIPRQVPPQVPGQLAESLYQALVPGW